MPNRCEVLTGAQLGLLNAEVRTIALVLTTLVEVYINDENNPVERRMEVFAYYGTFTRCALLPVGMSCCAD